MNICEGINKKGNKITRNNNKLKLYFSRLRLKHKKIAGKKNAITLKPIGRNISPINPVINPCDFLSLSFSLVMKKAEEKRMEKDTAYHWSIDGNLVQKRRAPYTPEKKFSGSIELKRGKNTFITFTSIYTGEKVAYFYDFLSSGYKTKRIDDVTICNLGIHKKLGEKFLLSFRIDNLFDKKYKANFGYTLDDEDYPASGRSISLGFSFRPNKS